MFARIGRTAATRRWWVVAATIVFLVFAGIWGVGVFGSLTGGSGFDDPHSESARADRILAGPLSRYAADVVVLYESPTRTVDDPAFAGSVQHAVAGVPAGSTTRVASYWTTHDG